MSTALAATVLVGTMRLVSSHAYPDGAPPGFSGGFKEESCHACHFHAEPNTPPGAVTLEGVPARFTPGTRYTLTVSLQRAGMKLAGFQLTARFTGTGSQAGSLAPADADRDRLSVEVQSGIQYVGQKKGGTSVSGDAARWTVEWTAPASGETVTFHVAANAADGNGSADGDYVFTTAEESGAPAEGQDPQPKARSPEPEAY